MTTQAKPVTKKTTKAKAKVEATVKSVPLTEATITNVELAKVKMLSHIRRGLQFTKASLLVQEEFNVVVSGNRKSNLTIKSV